MLRAALRFGIVGVANTLVGLAVIAAMLRLGAGDWAANAASYAVGLCVSFTLNRRWTFGVRGTVDGRDWRCSWPSSRRPMPSILPCWRRCAALALPKA